MADTTKISNEAANAEADAFSDKLDDGFLRIYDGSQPATVDTAIGAQNLLAELRFANPASGAAVNGVITFSAITSDTAADATGTASWFRAFKADGTSAIWDGSVGTAGATINMNSTAIQINAQVDVTSLSFTVQKG